MKLDRQIPRLIRTLAFLFILQGSVLQAGKNDTPETVMTVAKQGSIEAADIFVVVHEANSFLNRLSSDRSYASKFLEAVQKNNPTDVSSVVKQTAPRCQVSVLQLRPDFFAVVNFKMKGRIASVCVSSENNCSGQASTIDLK